MVTNPPVVLQNALSEELSNMKKLQDDLLANKVTSRPPHSPAKCFRRFVRFLRFLRVFGF
jgi:hypothetical protein